VEGHSPSTHEAQEGHGDKGAGDVVAPKEADHIQPEDRDLKAVETVEGDVEMADGTTAARK
jgi:hypothetical protein